MQTPNKTVHSSRTLMFAELANVMEHAIMDDAYLGSLNDNVINKKSRAGVDKTSRYLRTLYGFDMEDPAFRSFKLFWQQAEEKDKPLLSIILGITRDYLLNESIEVVSGVRVGKKVATSDFQSNIDRIHPAKYSESSKEAISTRLASSWKQAGFIEGKVKNIRVEPQISYKVVGFALLLAYLQGHRGDFIMSSRVVKALCLPDAQLRELIIEASQRGLLQYQYAGSITSLSFTDLLSKLGVEDV